MVRSVTSSVAALWGFVANGHQAVHPVSSSPSEIPYGGFSPVRLQTGLGPSPSSPGAHPATYKRPEFRSPTHLLSSFHPMSYLAETSNMTTRPRTAITVTALAAAGQAALQAATQIDTDGHR